MCNTLVPYDMNTIYQKNLKSVTHIIGMELDLFMESGPNLIGSIQQKRLEGFRVSPISPLLFFLSRDSDPRYKTGTQLKKGFF